jgi:hypothetical protein
MKVRHKLTNQILTIVKDYGTVALCRLPEPKHFSGQIWIDNVVCLKANLEEVKNKQLKLEI